MGIYNDDQFDQAEAAGFNPYKGSDLDQPRKDAQAAQAQPLPTTWTVPNTIPDWLTD